MGIGDSRTEILIGGSVSFEARFSTLFSSHKAKSSSIGVAYHEFDIGNQHFPTFERVFRISKCAMLVS